MQLPQLTRLCGLISLSLVNDVASRQLRSHFALSDDSRQTGYAWDYQDEGESWKDGSCASTDGDQSPINISTTLAANAPDSDILYFRYPTYEGPVKMVNDGRFLYARLPNEKGKMGGIALGASYPDHLTAEWQIYKMVFHTPSEHTFDGKKVPLELQLYHYKKGGKFPTDEPAPAETAVVAVGFHESRDEASPFLKSLIDGGLPDQRGASTLVNRAFPSILKWAELFNPVFGASGEKAGFWDYTGSQTQPPCSGGIRWFVRHEPLNAKRETLKYFASVTKKSSGGARSSGRKLQDIAGRPVFPRKAVNAVHSTVFRAEAPVAYKAALDGAQAEANAFAEGLAADTAGVDAAIKRGAGLDECLLASNSYKDCAEYLGTVTNELEVANTQKKEQCNIAIGHKKTADSIGGGPAKLEAQTKAAAAKKACDDQTKVVTAKEGQAATTKNKCNAIKSNIALKIKKHKEAEAKKAEEAKKDEKEKTKPAAETK